RPERVVSQVISLGARWDTFELVAEEFRFTTTDAGGDGTNPNRPLDIVTDTANVNLRDSYNANYPDPEDLRQTIGSVDAGTDTITLNGHGLQDDARVVFFGADLPAPLVEGTTYFVINATANTFQVSATQGGAAIDLTDAGSGTQEVRLVVDVPVVIDPNVQVFSTDPFVPALTVGNWPAGVNITLTVRTGAYVVGAGGAGGDVTNDNGGTGQSGGTGLFTRYAITVENEGTIAGGGGGGGAGGTGSTEGVTQIAYGGAGGGGAGRINGVGGSSPGPAQTQTTDGTLTLGGDGGTGEGQPSAATRGGNGGDGGDLGQAGGNGTISAASGIDPLTGLPGAGGAAGEAIDGDSLVTLSGSGSVLGPQVN
ncbi:MAG: hypothetical protein V2J02_03590, partial [Pseudomonadales bacterium]|nr:hypothetical protein [Pseudomonadales bacterium]